MIKGRELLFASLWEGFWGTCCGLGGLLNHGYFHLRFDYPERDRLPTGGEETVSFGVND